MNRQGRSLLISLLVAGLVAACSGAGAATIGPSPVGATAPPASAAVSSAPAAGPTSAPSTNAASSQPSLATGAGPVPCAGTITTPTTAETMKLTQTYDTSHAVFDPANVGGLTPGLVNAEWFRGQGGTYIVWFADLCHATAPVCPGASLKVGTAFQDIVNAPTGAGGCAGDTKYLAVAPAGVQICNKAFVFLVTPIPDTATGTLYASVEKGQADGTTIVGLTSSIATSATTPTIDLTKLSCAAPGSGSY